MHKPSLTASLLHHDHPASEPSQVLLQKPRRAAGPLRPSGQWDRSASCCFDSEWTPLLSTDVPRWLLWLWTVPSLSRSARWCPGYWDLTFEGMVRYGESYQENAEREVKEELNIDNVALDPIYKFLFEFENSKTFYQVFLGVYKGNVKPQYEEVECVSLMTKEEFLKRMRKGENFTPDSKMAWEGLMRKFGISLEAWEIQYDSI